MRQLIYVLHYLYASMRWRLCTWLVLATVASVLEGFSIGLFLPILEGAGSDTPLNQFFTMAFDHFGLPYTLSIVLGVMVFLYTAKAVFMTLQQIYAAKLISDFVARQKIHLVSRLFKLDYQHFIRRGMAYFINAATIEFSNLSMVFNLCGNFIVSSIFTLTYITLALFISPSLTGSLIVLSVPLYFLFRKMFSLTRKISIRTTENNSRLQSYLINAFEHFKYLKATGSTEGISRLIYDASREQGHLLFRQKTLSALGRNGMDLFSVFLIVTLSFYYVDVLGFDLIKVLFILFVLRRAMTYFQQTQRNFQSFLSFSGSVTLLQRLNVELSEYKEVTNSAGVVPDFDQPIRFENVSFAYNDSETVLEKLNLIIPPKKTVAFVGASGAGKSTLVTLLSGILRPTLGTISIGEVSYDEINHEKLRKGIGYVTQEGVIFNDTVYNNVTLWNSERVHEKTRAAAGANATDFIEKLPRGYDTLLGDKGVNLSGGQRQRVSIARELYKDAHLLIFDEATSALDTESEGIIQRYIDQFRGRKTVFLIAHRLSTVKNSDMIFVLKDGHIVEQGTYEDLCIIGNEFIRMVAQQAVGYSVPDNDAISGQASHS